jgi:peptide/nickel transport system permease protein
LLSYLRKRLQALIPVLFGVSLIAFLMIRLIPGDPARVILGELATDEAIAKLNTRLGLDQPWIVQYFDYLFSILRGDFGYSLTRNQPISDEIWVRFAATAELALSAMLFAVVFGVLFGILSARFHNTWFDQLMMLVALAGVSIPVFWLGVMGKMVFSLQLGLLPSIGREGIREPVDPVTNFYLIDTLIAGRTDQFATVLQHLIMPSIVLGSIPLAVIARMTRSSMLEVMGLDFMRTATSKGLSDFTVVTRHGLRNAFVPVLTIIGLQFGALLGGAILTETIFGWPGIGTYLYDAIQARDYTVIQTGILVISLAFVLINLVVDLLYAAIDPRIKY